MAGVILNLKGEPPADSAGAGAMPLSGLAQDELARVVEVSAADDDAVRLKSLGLCIGRRVQLVKLGDPLIVRVLGTRVGLSARLADCVSVQILS
jgi:Fe2+ transport system protein FeoA